MSKKPTTTERRWMMLADPHTGANTGLTAHPTNAIQRQLRERWHDCINHFGPRPHVVVLNGDGIDGTDPKGGDVDETDMFKQTQSCAESLYEWGATDEYIIVAGTHYHTSVQGQAVDQAIVSHLRWLIEQDGGTALATYRRKLKTTINDWFLLECRHKIGRSVVPHGRRTAPERTKFWNVLASGLKSRRTGKPASWPDLVVFGHVHYYGFAEDAYGASMTLPCWLAVGSRYGDEQCDGSIDLGAVELTIGAQEQDGWQKQHRLYLPALVERTERR